MDDWMDDTFGWLDDEISFFGWVDGWMIFLDGWMDDEIISLDDGMGG